MWYMNNDTIIYILIEEIFKDVTKHFTIILHFLRPIFTQVLAKFSLLKSGLSPFSDGFGQEIRA